MKRENLLLPMVVIAVVGTALSLTAKSTSTVSLDHLTVLSEQVEFVPQLIAYKNEDPGPGSHNAYEANNAYSANNAYTANNAYEANNAYTSNNAYDSNNAYSANDAYSANNAWGNNGSSQSLNDKASLKLAWLMGKSTNVSMPQPLKMRRQAQLN